MLSFDVINQTLKRVDRFSPATDSVNYLKAEFNFKTDDWSDKTKYALFRLGTKTYAEALDSKNTCIVPFEVLKATDESKASIGAKNKVFVTLVGEKGTVRVPTNALRVDLETSGYTDAENGADPTPDLYAQYIAEVTAAVEEHAANAKSSMNVASEKAAEASESAASLKNDYSNALKGVASGAVVRVDDVSPVEHYPVVKVHGKNLFNVSKITDANTATNNGDGSITIAANTYYCRLNQKLCEVCPQLKAGDTAVLSFKSTSPNTKYIYFHGLQGTWNAGNYITITDDILNSYVTIYGFSDNDPLYGNECIISDIQIELGDTATEYTPYVDPSTVTVTRCGKNLLNIRTENKQTVSGVTFTFDEEGKCTVSGTNNEANIIHVYATTSASDIVIPKGTTVTISGLPDNHKCCLRVFTNTTTGNTVGGLQGDYYETQTITVTEDTVIQNVLVRVAGGETVNIVFEPMLEVGDTATEFERFKKPVTYIPTTDGVVKGVTSLSPNITLLTDTEGVTVECEYNQDINKAFERLKNVVIALGGVV